MRCSKCSRILRPGEIRYCVRIALWADTGGYIPAQEALDVDRRLSSLLDRIQRMDTAELERDVYQQLEFVLCPDCRQQFLANPLNKELDPHIPDSLPLDDET